MLESAANQNTNNGMKPIHRATIDDVAELAGVSIKTVSRVVNHEPNVRESTRIKVDQAIAKLNYRPNLSARNLASNRARLIGLIYDDPSIYEAPSSGYVIRMQHGVLRECHAAGFELLIHPCNYRDRHVTEQLKTLIDNVRPAGIVLAAPLSNMPRIVQAIADTNTPFVPISPGSNDDQPYTVSTNDREASAKMTRYLASLGHRKIAFIKGHRQHKAVHERYLGYKDGLADSGLEFIEGFVADGDNSIGSGEACARQLLEQQDRPTALFAANDDMAAGVIRVADQIGLKIPRDVSVAGWDDIPLAMQVYPSLTTIRQPLATMAEQAAMFLTGRLPQDRSTADHGVLPASLQVRESTGPAPD